MVQWCCVLAIAIQKSSVIQSLILKTPHQAGSNIWWRGAEVTVKIWPHGVWKAAVCSSIPHTFSFPFSSYSLEWFPAEQWTYEPKDKVSFQWNEICMSKRCVCSYFKAASSLVCLSFLRVISSPENTYCSAMFTPGSQVSVSHKGGTGPGTPKFWWNPSCVSWGGIWWIHRCLCWPLLTAFDMILQMKDLRTQSCWSLEVVV